MRRYVALMVGTDVVAAIIAAVTAYPVRFTEGASGYLALCVAMPVIWVAALAMGRAYDEKVIGLGPEEFQRVARSFVGLLAVVCFFSYATKAEVARG